MAHTFNNTLKGQSIDRMIVDDGPPGIPTIMTNVLVDELPLENRAGPLPGDMAIINLETTALDYWITTDLGKFVVDSSPQGADCINPQYIRDYDPMKAGVVERIMIFAWLTDDQIDRIQTAYFKTLPRKGNQHKYIYE